ncbi:MAG: DUF4214 domain-containing protein [Actinomycetota bacterium]
MFRRIARLNHTRPRRRSGHVGDRRHRTATSRAAVAAAVVAALVAVAGVGPGAAQTPSEQESTTSAAFTGSATSANARFVVDAYQTLLGRDPDTAGLDFHLARLASGGSRSRQAVTYALLFSAEGSRGEVGRAYQDLLDRAPDGPGSDYWTSHLEGNGVVDLRVLLLASDEYRTRAGATDQSWIEALYVDVLGRGADASGLAYWTGQASAGVARALIAAAVYQSDEALARRATAYYSEILGRSPSTGERDGAVATIRRIGERGLRAELLASDEAFESSLQAALS